MNAPPSDALEIAINELRVSDSIVVLGAGASFEAGMPLAGQLAPLVWHALDRHPDALRNVGENLHSSPGPAKSVVGDKWNHSRGLSRSNMDLSLLKQT